MTQELQLPPRVSRQDYQQSLSRLQRFARAMDSKFRLPVIGMRVGWDAILGLVPGIGDLAGVLLSGYVLVEAWRLKVPRPLLGRMLLNVLIEFLVGLVPVLGDLFDAYWKANLRNVQLLQNHIERQLQPPAKVTGSVLSTLLVVLLIGVLIILAVAALTTQS